MRNVIMTDTCSDKVKLNDAVDLRHQFCKINVFVAINSFLKPLQIILKACV